MFAVLELFSAHRVNKQCLNRTFKQAATEPWMASGGRIGICDSYLGCARQPAAEQREGAIPGLRLRILSKYKLGALNNS